MVITNERQPWLSSHSSHGSYFQNDNLIVNPSRIQTPVLDSQRSDSAAVVHEDNPEEEAQRALFKGLYKRSSAKLAALFRGEPIQVEDDTEVEDVHIAPTASETVSIQPVAVDILPKKPARVIDEDNYDDDEDEEDESAHTINESPLKHRSTNALSSPPRTVSSPLNSDKSSTKSLEKDKDTESHEQPKTSEDARKQLEESKKATEEAVKRSFHTKFYTLENDRIAMLEQQTLDESETQIDQEMEHGRNAGSGSGANAETQLGTLSSANLGTASLTLKHLIARIDQKRELVKASDAELRTLMNEVRKNRSKWANEDQIGQEELYEAAEKVLNELKAMTEYSTPFLQRVNKREAPDYYNIIKHPMDFSNMTKKLKSTSYKSKAEFVSDLELIWGNCLKYNADMGHALRRNANMMKKESEKLIPLIPDITIRSRAEVEAEERRRGEDGGEESDDEPIMSSRGRKPGVKGASKTRGAPAGRAESTPGVENKPVIQVNGIRGNHLGSNSSDAGIEGSQSGFATPPIPGSVTPSGINGIAGHSDSMDLDAPPINGTILNQALSAAANDIYEDEEYKIWKQVTKKDRARVAKERNRLFRGDRLNPDEPALLRTKAGMRRLLRQQKQALASSINDDSEMGAALKGSKDPVETLAEGMDGEEDIMLPDYYDCVNMIPDINPKLQWIEDADGQLIDPSGEFLRMIPKGYFTAPQGSMTAKIEANMKQMQETRKLCSKIGVIKQMQLQSQMYNNQFQKYSPEPFMEADIEPQTVSIDGAVMSSWTCHAAFQRSVGKLCYHAGFEELQPSALDAITDLAADFFAKIAKSFSVYSEAPKVPATGTLADKGQRWQPAYTNEEIALHTLSENGFDVESLDSYAREDMDKLGSKLGVMHDRMKAHLTDLLRPALQDAGPDGAGAFKDGSDQFVGGDFAEDLDEDFFGFKELGLMEEFGLSSLSVPLHLLQTKLHQGYQAHHPSAIAASATSFEALPPFEPVTIDNIENEIGLVKDFFKGKMRDMGIDVLIEDEELPQKQRFPKPRLPPTGKITSPRKRPLREQIGNAKKKKKLENGLAMEMGGSSQGLAKGGANNSSNNSNNIGSSPIKAEGGDKGNNALNTSAKKLKSALLVNGNGTSGLVERADSAGEKDEVGMMSPESLER